jgi:hypothetical protein
MISLPTAKSALFAPIFAVLMASLLPSCVSIETAAPPVPAVANASQKNYQQLCTGRELYLGKCTKCHSPEVIKKFSLEDWTGDIMPSMAKKSKISAEEEACLMAYITTVSKAPTPVPTKS